MEYSLLDAARAARVNKSTVLRAIKGGRLSARREEGGTYRIDASELARVYDLRHLAPVAPRGTEGAMPQAATADAPSAPPLDIEVAVLRARLEAAEAQAARERETVADLRKRLDRAEERVLALTVQPAPQPVPEPSAVVEELRQRLQESEARNQVLSAAVAPQWPKERLSEAPEKVTPPKGARSFLGRLLGR